MAAANWARHPSLSNRATPRKISSDRTPIQDQQLRCPDTALAEQPVRRSAAKPIAVSAHLTSASGSAQAGTRAASLLPVRLSLGGTRVASPPPAWRLAMSVTSTRRGARPLLCALEEKPAIGVA